MPFKLSHLPKLNSPHIYSRLSSRLRLSMADSSPSQQGSLNPSSNVIPEWIGPVVKKRRMEKKAKQRQAKVTSGSSGVVGGQSSQVDIAKGIQLSGASDGVTKPYGLFGAPTTSPANVTTVSMTTNTITPSTHSSPSKQSSSSKRSPYHEPPKSPTKHTVPLKSTNLVSLENLISAPEQQPQENNNQNEEVKEPMSMEMENVKVVGSYNWRANKEEQGDKKWGIIVPGMFESPLSLKSTSTRTSPY